MLESARPRPLQAFGQSYMCPVSRALRTAVELDVLLLTPSDAVKAGDPDNRIKTLIDGLTVPQNPQMAAALEPPEPGEVTYCLMDDDSRVSRLTWESRPWFANGAYEGDAYPKPPAAPGTPTEIDTKLAASGALVIVTARIVFGHDASTENSAPSSMLLVL